MVSDDFLKYRENPREVHAGEIVLATFKKILLKMNSWITTLEPDIFRDIFSGILSNGCSRFYWT